VRGRLAGIIVVTAVLTVVVILYIADFLTVAPPTVSAAVQNGTERVTLQTMATWGHAPNPDWVTYMGQDASGQWHRTTIYKLPAHTLVTFTIYQFDTATGLRNPFLAQIRGTQGGVATINCSACSPAINGPVSTISPADASHTFTVPDLGLSVPLPGVSSHAKNLCSAGPCTLDEAHNTITFSFMTPGPGTYRWQCFVPCAVGFYFGNGGPMQTIGWMSGELEVV
jgi:hypothetical protein